MAPCALIFYLVSDRDPVILGGFMICALCFGGPATLMSFFGARSTTAAKLKAVYVMIMAANGLLFGFVALGLLASLVLVLTGGHSGKRVH